MKHDYEDPDTIIDMIDHEDFKLLKTEQLTHDKIPLPEDTNEENLNYGDIVVF